MERTKVNSSNIAEVGYDAESKTMQVQFKNGGVFNYEGVEPKKYVEMLSSESIGKFLHTNIKGQYNCTKQPEEKVDD